MKTNSKVLSISAAIAILTATCGTAVNASTFQVSFSASSFSNLVDPSNAAPVDPVTGSFTITFDPAVTNLTDTTAGITLDTLNINLGSTFGFIYNSSSSGTLVVGGIASSVDGVTNFQDDIALLISNFTSGTPSIGSVLYTQASNAGLFEANAAASSVSVSLVATTPLPAALPLFATGLGALGLLGWRRKRKAAAKAVA